MTVRSAGVELDTMGEACERLGISRATMLRYLADGFFTEPRRIKQGREKKVRVFEPEWYAENEERLRKAREE